MVMWQERSKHGGQNDNDQFMQSGLMFYLRHILDADNDHYCSHFIITRLQCIIHVSHISSVHAVPTNIKDQSKQPLTGGERIIPVPIT